MTLLNEIKSVKNKIDNLGKGYSPYSKLNPDPNCKICDGKGFYHWSVDEWFAKTVEYAKKIGSSEVISPKPLEEFRPNGIKVFCDCNSNSKETIYRRLNAHKAKMEIYLEYLDEVLGTNYIDKGFDDYFGDRKTVVVKWLESIYNGAKKNLFLSGCSGSGKTHLLSAIYQSFVTLGKRCEIVKCNKLNDQISDYRANERNYFIDKYGSSEILLMDDIGLGKLTQERSSVYYSILDYRASNNLITIYTSNYKPDEIFQDSEVPPERIIRRIKENCDLINLTLIKERSVA